MYNLTGIQVNILHYIKQYLNSYNEAPTVSQISEEFHFKSKRAAAYHLEILQSKGLIRRDSSPRGITVLEESNKSFINIPILGYANAGYPLIQAEENYLGELKVDKKLVRELQNLFAVELKGDSMNKCKIDDVTLEDGNYVIISKDSEYENGSIVLAIIDECATVKAIMERYNTVILYPESKNPKHRPIYLTKNSNGFIVGKVISALTNPLKNNI